MTAHPIAPDLARQIERDVDAAFAEDVGSGDLTVLLIDAETRSRASVISRVDCVLCGTRWFESCFRRLDPKVVIRWNASDGDRVAAGQTLCSLEGRSRALLTGEQLQAIGAAAGRLSYRYGYGR